MRAIAGASALVMIGLCAACYSTVERNDLVGAWEARADGHSVGLNLHGDGTLTGEGVPRAALTGPRISSDEEALDWADTVDFTARWAFSEASSASFSQGSVSVQFDNPDAAWGMSLVASTDELDLYYGNVELGQHLTFDEREPAATPIPATLSRTALVGTWSSANAGTLDLSDDGAFTLANVPEPLSAFLNLNGSRNLTGSWLFEEQVLPLSEQTTVLLSVSSDYRTSSGSFVSFAPALKATDDGYVLEFHAGEFHWVKDQ